MATVTNIQPGEPISLMLHNCTADVSAIYRGHVLECGHNERGEFVTAQISTVDRLFRGVKKVETLVEWPPSDFYIADYDISFSSAKIDAATPA